MAPREDDASSRIDALLRPVAEEMGLDVEVELSGSSGRQVLRLVTEPQQVDAELTVDQIAQLSRRASALLDAEDPLPGAYTLEVTSPGTDRPLTRPRQLARSIGRELRVMRHSDPAPLVGVLVAVDDSGLTLEVEGDPVLIDIADLDHAVVLLPW